MPEVAKWAKAPKIGDQPKKTLYGAILDDIDNDGSEFDSVKHPIVFLKDVQVSQVKAILDYMYKGEVSVAQQELPALLRVAELLRVKGMIEENKDLKVEKEEKPKKTIPISSIRICHYQ